jgi:hypothetical protein
MGGSAKQKSERAPGLPSAPPAAAPRPSGAAAARRPAAASTWGDTSRSARGAADGYLPLDRVETRWAVGGNPMPEVCDFHQAPCKCNAKWVGMLWNREGKGARAAAPGPPEVASLASTRGRLPGPKTAVFWLLSALRAHTKAPYKNDSHRKTLRALKRPGGPGQRRKWHLRPS